MPGKKTSVANLGVLVSGGGTNLQAIIDACESGVLNGLARVAVVVSNRPDAYALERARRHGITAVFLDRKDFADTAAYSEALAREMERHAVVLVCLAGFLVKLEPNFVRAFRRRIVNIHPALLPKFGGKGMYGHHVHEAVVAGGERESGATVHWVDEEYDHGPAILQAKVPVLPDDTAETLAERVLAVEHTIYPRAIKKAIETLKAER